MKNATQEDLDAICELFPGSEELRKLRPVSKTTVVNIRDHPDWKEKGYVYIGRGTIVGNPYRIGNGLTRLAVLGKYRDDFCSKIKKSLRFREAVYALTGKTLVCHCAPKGCHGHIIAAYLNRRSENGEDT